MYKVLVFDIDNTLINRGKATVEESALQAIRECHDKGYEIVICTGRTINAVHPDILARVPGNYFIGVNGASLNKFDGELLHCFYMSEQSVEKIIEIALKHDYHLGFKFTDSFQIYNRYDEFTSRYCKGSITEDMLNNCPGRDYHLKKEMPLDAFIYADDDMLPQYFDQFDDLKFVRANSRKIIYEAFNKEADKGVMLGILLDRLGYTYDQAIAFGDSQNDCEMIIKAGLGICMGNGTREAKAVADYVTDDIDKDGIWKALKHFEII